MLDRLSPAQRHLALLIIAALLGALAVNIDLLGLPDTFDPFIGAIVTALIAWVTPLTRQYGVGSGGEEG